MNILNSKNLKIKLYLQHLFRLSKSYIQKRSQLLRPFKSYNDGHRFGHLLFFGLFAMLTTKGSLCYKASNKQLDAIMTRLDNEIKNLEFRYEGKLRRQPIK